VRNGGEAFFNNANDIVNIFSRVTGGNISNIDGLLRANGSANLFLINPAGIIFGEGARLDIGGSFYGTSADSILFEDGEFSATDLDNPPLLTINAPIGLSFRDNPGDIVNRSNFGLTETVLDENFDTSLAGRVFTLQDSIGLEVNPSQSINLIGGNVILENAAGITAPGGRVELGGLSEVGVITVNTDGSLTFPEGVARANVSLSGQSRVNVAAGGDGFINVNARNLTVSEGSRLFGGIAENMGSSEAQAGDLIINATDSLTSSRHRRWGIPKSFAIAEVLGSASPL
jgi:filamentous hemagglutinin family protein